MLVLASYNYEDTLCSISVCNGLAAALGIRDKFLILNNHNLEFSSFHSVRDWHFLTGTNSNHEFSAWQQALDLHPFPHDVRFVIFVNDTVGRPISEFKNIDMLSFINRVASISPTEAVGFVANYSQNQRLSILGRSSGRRMCTALFAVSTVLIKRLNNQIDYQLELSSLLNPHYSPIDFMSTEAPSCLRSHLHSWLLDGQWHSAGCLPMSHDEFTRLRSKALCILNEIYFSALCESSGGRLVSLTPFAQTNYFHQFTRVLCWYQGVFQYFVAKIPSFVTSSVRLLKGSNHYA